MGIDPRLKLAITAQSSQLRATNGAKIDDHGVGAGAEGSIEGCFGKAALSVNGRIGSAAGAGAQLSYQLPIAENSGFQVGAYTRVVKEVMPTNNYTNITTSSYQSPDLNNMSLQETVQLANNVSNNPSSYIDNAKTSATGKVWSDSDFSYGVGAGYYHNLLNNNLQLKGSVQYEWSSAFDTPENAPGGRPEGKSFKAGLSFTATPLNNKSYELSGGVTYDFNKNKKAEWFFAIRKTFDLSNIFHKK